MISHFDGRPGPGTDGAKRLGRRSSGIIIWMNDERAGKATMLSGRYELGSLLGHGGMGTVRDATDRRLG